MGMNHAGELAALTRMVRPHVAIVTTIAPAHMEFFGSEEAIADAIGSGLDVSTELVVETDYAYDEINRLTDLEHYVDVVTAALEDPVCSQN